MFFFLIVEQFFEKCSFRLPGSGCCTRFRSVRSATSTGFSENDPSAAHTRQDAGPPRSGALFETSGTSRFARHRSLGTVRLRCESLTMPFTKPACFTRGTYTEKREFRVARRGFFRHRSGRFHLCPAFEPGASSSAARSEQQKKVKIKSLKKCEEKSIRDCSVCNFSRLARVNKAHCCYK